MADVNNISVGQKIHYNNRNWKVLKIEADKAHLKCMDCSNRTIWVEISKL